MAWIVDFVGPFESVETAELRSHLRIIDFKVDSEMKFGHLQRLIINLMCWSFSYLWHVLFLILNLGPVKCSLSLFHHWHLD